MRGDRPSATARLIARATLLAADDPSLQVLVPDRAPALLEQILTEDHTPPWFDFVRRHRWAARWAARWAWRIESLILPGIVAHYLARKRWIEQQVLSALHAGCDQVVILGAGYDTLAARLHALWPATSFFELDHPATQAPKARALGAVTSASVQNLFFLPLDFGVELPLSLLSACPRFQPSRRTCFVAEGLLMYFPVQRVSKLLRNLTTVRSSNLVFTFMEPGPDGRAAFRGRQGAVDSWLRLKRESFAWACSPADLRALFRACGWEIERLAGPDDLRREILTPVGRPHALLAAGEGLGVARNPTPLRP
jgi:methyltransferase (TIGR00027 family)